MSITLWIPAGIQPYWSGLLSWWNVETPNNEKLRLVRSNGDVVHGWNKVVKDFLETDDEWLFSVHNDVVLDKGTLMRLLSWGKPLVSALIFMRQSPVVPHIWNTRVDEDKDEVHFHAHRIQDTRDWLYSHPEAIKFGAYTMEPRPDDALTPVTFTSTSCMVINRKVLEDTRELSKEKWFEMDHPINGGGEDRRFFEYATQAGYQGYVDRSAVVGHLVGEVPTSAADFVVWDSVSVFNGTGEAPDPKKPIFESGDSNGNN